MVVLDPPRAGCDRPLIDALNQAGASRIVYVSCDPATLARDLAMLSEAYKVQSVQLVDMFPMTGHIETVCLLSKNS